MNVTIYSTPTCPYCHQAESFLKERGVKFAKHDVSVDRTAADKMVQVSGQMGVPVITVDDKVIIGFDRPRLEQLLKYDRSTSLGIRIIDVAKITGTHQPASGAYVDRVKFNSKGEIAGLRKGDIITGINQLAIQNADDLAVALLAVPKGSKISIDFLRDDGPLECEVPA